MARDLEQRVGTVATDVDRRVRALARLPSSYWLQTGDERADPVDTKVLEGFAEALPFVENFKFVPRAPAPDAASGTRTWTWKSDSPAGEASPAPRAPVAPMSPMAPTAPVAASATPRPGPAESPAVQPSAAPEPSPVELEKLLRQAQASATVSVASLPPSMSPADREKLVAELEKVRREIGRTLALRYEAQQRARTIKARKIAEGSEAAGGAAPPVAPVEKPAPSSAELAFPVRDNGEVVGELTGKIKAKEILKSVLAQTHREQGEIPFALDEENQLYVSTDADGKALSDLPAVAALRGKAAADGSDVDEASKQWIVVAKKDPGSGLRYGIARPISRAIRELKTETALNFLAAFLLIGLTTVGMIPLTGGMVKNVQELEAGAARIAEGDLATRVPVTSRDEFGRLAASFNHMAVQLSEHQEKLLEQERIGKEREIGRRLLEAENDRKSRELEEARRFQLSLLPRKLPERAGLELGVAMSTATEVGGDYYDFREVAGGDLLVAIGDATGHGAAAGTMVTVVKSLFMAGGDTESPSAFLRRATGLVHGMGLSRMAMALALARLHGRRVTLSSAGMPPALHFRAAGGVVDEIALAGMPLGSRAEFPYAEAELDLAPGDTLLLMSDGFPELPNPAGEVLGYERARAIFAGVARQPADVVVAALEKAASEWAGSTSLNDDVTFLVLRGA